MLTTSEIKRFIEEDISSERKRLARVGQRYYDAEHDILNYRMFYYNADGILVEDKTRSNIRISHPFFTEQVDQLASYMLSFEDNPITAKDTADGLQDKLDTYFDDEFWAEVHELITGTNTKGFEYLCAYKNSDDRLAFKCTDGMGVIEVRAQDTDDGCVYVIYWYIDRIEKGQKKIKRIEVWDDSKIYYYVQVDDGTIMLDESAEYNPKPTYAWRRNGKLYTSADMGGLGFIPFWRLDNNRKQTSGLKPIKLLIDDYDLMMCGLSNNLQDFDTPLIVVDGFQGDNLDELQTNLKTKKIVGVDNGGIDYKTVDIPYEARKAKADEDEKNIYRFGMAFNSSQTGDGNITNVVIKSRYTLLELKASKLTMRLKKFLKGIIRVVLDEINEEYGTDYQYTDVKLNFVRTTPANDAENAQIALTEAQTQQIMVNTILSASTAIGDEETLKALCDALDIDFNDIKDILEERREVQNLLDAQQTLDSVVVDDEQQTEDSTGTVS